MEKAALAHDTYLGGYGLRAVLMLILSEDGVDAPQDDMIEERKPVVIGAAGIDAIGPLSREVGVRIEIVAGVPEAATNSAPSASTTGLVATSLLRALHPVRHQTPSGSVKTSVRGGVPLAVALEVFRPACALEEVMEKSAFACDADLTVCTVTEKVMDKSANRRCRLGTPKDHIADKHQIAIFGTAGIDAVRLPLFLIAVRIVAVGGVLEAAADCASSAATAGLAAKYMLGTSLFVCSEALSGSALASVRREVPPAIAL